MSLSFVLVGSQIKRFKTVVKALAGIGAATQHQAWPEAAADFELRAVAVVLPQAPSFS
jgi:hypothetical protein